MGLKVELEIRPNNLNPNFFFVLDDAEQGILQESPVFGSYDFVLGGNILIDVTEHVRTVNVSRGKNRETDSFGPGLANVVFNNHTRIFDPTWVDSPFYTYILPKRVIKISATNEVGNTFPVYQGIITDWNLSFDVTGDSFAAAACADALTLFATQSLTGGVQTEELSSVRVDKVLDQLEWPLFISPTDADQTDRSVFEGSELLGADTVEEGANALEYLQLIERSEAGSFYIAASGRPTFLGRNTGRGVGIQGFYSDDGTGTGYATIDVQYGSEYLFNETIISSIITESTATAVDALSQETFGLSSLVRKDLLMAEEDAVVDMALALTAKYSQPEFRFSGLTVITSELESGPDLNTLVQIKFTPNGIGDPIERYAQVIGVQYDITPSVTVMTLNFETISNTSWTLSDSIFGRLSAGNTLAW